MYNLKFIYDKQNKKEPLGDDSYNVVYPDRYGDGDLCAGGWVGGDFAGDSDGDILL